MLDSDGGKVNEPAQPKHLQPIAELEQAEAGLLRPDFARDARNLHEGEKEQNRHDHAKDSRELHDVEGSLLGPAILGKKLQSKKGPLSASDHTVNDALSQESRGNAKSILQDEIKRLESEKSNLHGKEAQQAERRIKHLRAALKVLSRTKGLFPKPLLMIDPTFGFRQLIQEKQEAGDYTT